MGTFWGFWAFPVKTVCPQAVQASRENGTPAFRGHLRGPPEGQFCTHWRTIRRGENPHFFPKIGEYEGCIYVRFPESCFLEGGPPLTPHSGAREKIFFDFFLVPTSGGPILGPPFGPLLGPLLGPVLGPVLDPFWTHFGHFGPILDHFGPILDHFGHFG